MRPRLGGSLIGGILSRTATGCSFALPVAIHHATRDARVSQIHFERFRLESRPMAGRLLLKWQSKRTLRIETRRSSLVSIDRLFVPIQFSIGFMVDRIPALVLVGLAPEPFQRVFATPPDPDPRTIFLSVWTALVVTGPARMKGLEIRICHAEFRSHLILSHQPASAVADGSSIGR